MKIAMDVSIMESCRTGTEEYTEGLVWGLHYAGTSVVSMGRGHSPILPDQPCLGLPHQRSRRWWQKWWWENLGLLNVPSDVNLVHIPYLTHPPRRLAVPTVVTVHDLIPFRLQEYHKKFHERTYFNMVRRRLPLASHLVAISQTTMRDIQELFPDLVSKVTVIPNGVHPTFFEPVSAVAVDSTVREFGLFKHPRLLYVGGYDSRKNVHTLVTAVNQVFRQRRDGQLVLVGALNHPEVTQWVNTLNMQEFVVLTPSISREVLAALYHAADLFVFPSTYEGFGLGPAQAMAAGIPVVASNIAAVMEVVGDAGVLVEPLSVEGWMDGISRVLDSPSLAQKMAARGRARAEDFAWKRVALQYHTLYSRLVR
jgi:glycosyltransferase involved in cell wall biosynthesis